MSLDYKTEVQPLITGLARHAMTAAAGALAGLGAIQTDQQTQFISIGSGILVWLAGYAWSAWQKRQQVKAIDRAKAGG